MCTPWTRKPARSFGVTKVDDHFVARITAAPKVYEGRVYVPVSSSEEFSSSNLDYSRRTGRGSVVTLDANTGAQVWKTYVVEHAEARAERIRKGVQQYAPSGGSIWNSPTIDAERGARLRWNRRRTDRADSGYDRRDHGDRT